MTKEITSTDNGRKVRASNKKGVIFPAPPASSSMPEWYGEMLNNISQLVAEGRRQVMWMANVQMSMMYYKSVLRYSKGKMPRDGEQRSSTGFLLI